MDIQADRLIALGLFPSAHRLIANLQHSHEQTAPTEPYLGLVDAKKSNQVVVSQVNTRFKVFFTKGVERQRKVMHCSGAD